MIKAFSLIELLCVFSLILIVSFFAYPSYQQHVQKLKRFEAKSALYQLAEAMETYALKAGTYRGATIATGKDSDIRPRDLVAGGSYRLKIVTATEEQYRLVAEALETGQRCGLLTLDALGERGPELDCWD